MSSTKETDFANKKRYIIEKNGYFYRENSMGYTTSVHEAGLYTLKEAEDIYSIEPDNFKIFFLEESDKISIAVPDKSKKFIIEYDPKTHEHSIYWPGIHHKTLRVDSVQKEIGKYSNFIIAMFDRIRELENKLEIVDEQRNKLIEIMTPRMSEMKIAHQKMIANSLNVEPGV